MNEFFFEIYFSTYTDTIHTYGYTYMYSESTLMRFISLAASATFTSLGQSIAC